MKGPEFLRYIISVLSTFQLNEVLAKKVIDRIEIKEANSEATTSNDQTRIQ